MEESKRKLFFQFYPEMYPNRKGSMASFSFRLLLAELPTYLGQPKTAMDKLTELSLISSEVNYLLLLILKKTKFTLVLCQSDKRFLRTGAG